MALPLPHITPKMLELQERLSKLSPEEFGSLPPLAPEDFTMIGIYINSYNVIDLNLRRALEIFKIGGVLPHAISGRYSKLVDAGLAAAFLETIKGIGPPDEDVELATEKLSLIDYGRGIRNLIAHFAAKRFPGEEVIVFATKNEKDAQQTVGKNLSNYHILTAVVGRLELQRLTRKVSEESDWLGRRIPIWFQRYVKEES